MAKAKNRVKGRQWALVNRRGIHHTLSIEKVAEDDEVLCTCREGDEAWTRPETARKPHKARNASKATAGEKGAV